MADTNYIASIVKILENPIQKLWTERIITTEFRAQLPQVRKTQIVKLVFWGNLARDITNYYQANDYLMIEGYLSFRAKNKKGNQKMKEAQITVLKAYFLKNESNSKMN